MKECADHMDWLAARLTEVHGEKFNMDYILAARRWAGWLRHKASPTTEQPGDAERLDWIIQQGDEYSQSVIKDAPGDGEYQVWGMGHVFGRGITPRDAIDDAARTQGKKGEQG